MLLIAISADTYHHFMAHLFLQVFGSIGKTSVKFFLFVGELSVSYGYHLFPSLTTVGNWAFFVVYASFFHARHD